MRRAAVCSIVPPHILRNIAERGDDDAPAMAQEAIAEALDGSGKVYDFYWKAFGRDSIDGRGLRLDSAFWNGRQMIYDGRYFQRFTKCLDVIGHELTHAVTQYSARLRYENESGALNEHFSDVFGVLTRQFASRQTATKADWLVGAGLFTKKVEGVAIRSMKAPGTAYDDSILGKDPQPAHMREYDRTTDDDGGVHINSGIPNRAFYEASILLGGKAWAVAGKIWYRTLTEKLRPASRFQDCADATYESAGELFGSQSAPQLAVLAAWRTVGIVVSDSIVAAGRKIRFRAPEPYQPPAPAAELPAALPRVRS